MIQNKSQDTCLHVGLFIKQSRRNVLFTLRLSTGVCRKFKLAARNFI